MVAARCYPFMGGIETHVDEVGPRMAARGHQVDVLTTDPSGDLPVEEDVRGMRVRRVAAWPKKLDLYWAPDVYAAIRRGTWDLVHFQGYNTFVAPLGMLAAIRSRIPFVLTFHSGGHSSRLRNAVRRPQHALLRPLIIRADRLIGVSEFEADFFSTRLRLPKERFAVVPNGAAMLRASPGVRVDPNLIVSSGRLERYKGHHRIIEAMPYLIERMPNARLRIAGKGPYEGELRKRVATLGLQSRITIAAIPAADRQGMTDLLASAGLFVLFSEYEAHPVAVMEAVALRRPVLTSDTSGLREIARKGLGRALPLDTAPKDLAAAIAEDLMNPRVVPDLDLPDWDACARSLSDIYREVLSRPPATHLSRRIAMPS